MMSFLQALSFYLGNIIFGECISSNHLNAFLICLSWSCVFNFWRKILYSLFSGSFSNLGWNRACMDVNSMLKALYSHFLLYHLCLWICLTMLLWMGITLKSFQKSQGLYLPLLVLLVASFPYVESLGYRDSIMGPLGVLYDVRCGLSGGNVMF